MEHKIKLSKAKKILLIVVSALLLTFILFHYFFPSFHYETHEGVEYYRDGSYTKLGFGFNRYGKIASKYLPEYDDVSKDASYLDFYYSDSSFGITRFVITAVGVRYDTERYEAIRDEILQTGTDFGSDGFHALNEERSYRLIEQKTRANGEHLYYIVSCCDTDNAIMYLLFTSTNDIDRPMRLFDQTGLHSRTFWKNLHPTTAYNFSPKYPNF